MGAARLVVSVGMWLKVGFMLMYMWAGSGGGGGGGGGGYLMQLSCAATLTASRQKLVEVHNHLRGPNKPSLKTIQSPDGDIIDCVHISHQPAFDHPLLKDHKIQMRPSYHPDGLYDDKKMAGGTKEGVNSMAQLWHMNGKCPNDTIPIRRTKKDDVMRASSLKMFGKKRNTSIPKPRSLDSDPIYPSTGHEYAIAYVEGDKYYGAKATINVWEPKIQQSDEFSLSQIWLVRGSFYVDLNTIEAGWQVNPHLYGDNNPRLFTYWTNDGYQATGCYNLVCSGFIQTSSEIAVGGSISPVSEYSDSQYDVSVLIWKGREDGNWWLKYGNGYVLGYWPSSLFSYLSDSASMVQWGGEVVNSESNGEHTSTQMGSGHFAEEGYGKSSYVRNIQVVDSSNNLQAPQGLVTQVDDSNCYDIQIESNEDWGDYFYFGGPGRNPNCT